MFRFLVAILFTLPAFCATPPGMTCATCHRAESQSQPKSAMGIGIEMGASQSILEAHPKLAFEANGYNYSIERKGDVSTYTVSDGANSLSLPIRYAFGTHMQTFVFDYQGKFYESMVSYYPSINGLAITLGRQRIHPQTLVEAMGKENSTAEITACFGCHSSGGVTREKLALDAVRPGLDCEHCHIGAGEHLAAMSQGKTAPVPRKLGLLSAEDTSTFCGQCHRTWETIIRMKQFGEANVRFQPYRIANSKCFLGDDKRISCTGCHNPHAPLVTDLATYDADCKSCHSETVAHARLCKVATSNCVSCHMPKVQVPGNPALFTDHQIRVVKAGEPYPN